MKIYIFNILGRLMPVFIIIASAIGLHNMQLALDLYPPSRDELLSEMAYFPSGKFLKSLLCGYDMLVADYIWLKTIQYYGQHSMIDLKYDWLPHMFDILTTLDPMFIQGYRLGGLLISEDAQEPELAIKLLTKGMYNNPERFEIPFDMGFINYIVTKDYKKAAKYFWLTYIHEGIMGRGIRFAAMSYRKAGDFENAKAMWRKVLALAPDSSRRETARRSIGQIQISEDLEILKKALRVYKAKKGKEPATLTDFVTEGIIKFIPEEPFGGYYAIKSTGEIVSSTQLYDALEMIVYHLNQRIIAYKSAKGNTPYDLQELVEKNFVKELPEHPFGQKYIYDRTEGKVNLPEYKVLIKEFKENR